MFNFHIPQTPTDGWQSLVIEAQVQSGYQFDEELENYLVITLDHFTSNESLSHSIIALDFLHALETTGTSGQYLLRTVGDQCLLLSGLFPERALKKNVSLNYFIRIGRQAYAEIAVSQIQSSLSTELFNNLSVHFVGLIDTLNTIRLMHQS